jgi:predicted Zn-dependent protease
MKFTLALLGRTRLRRYSASTALGMAALIITGCSHKSAGNKPKTVPVAAVESAAEKAVATNPADASARIALAKEYAAAGESFAGIEQLEVARGLDPKNLDILAELATAYDSLGETEHAAELLAGAHAKDATALQLSGLYLKLGDFTSSATALLDCKTADAIAKARSLLLAGGPAQAAALIQKGSSSPDMLAMEGLVNLEVGDFKPAVEALKKSYQMSHDPWTGYLAARAELKSGQSLSALEDLRSVIQTQNSAPQAAILLADLALDHKEPDEANAALNLIKGADRRLPAYWRTAAKEARLRKHEAAARMMDGYAEYNSGDPWKAEKIWSELTHDKNDDIAMQACIAVTNCALRRQDPDSASKSAKEGATRWPKNPETVRLLAETLLAMSQPNEALAPAQKYQTAAPSERQEQAAELLCRIGLDTDRPDIVSANAEKARELAPNDPMPLLHLAELQAKKGNADANLKKTLALYEQAGKADPNNAEAAAHAGLILADLKRTKDAERTILHALTLNPRTLDGAANAVLIKLYQAEKKTREVAFEADWYQRVRGLKDPWPTALKTMRQAAPGTSADAWKTLAELALKRHENWIALCAARRWSALQPRNNAAWVALAAAQKRFGMFDEALNSMLQSHNGIGK